MIKNHSTYILYHIICLLNFIDTQWFSARADGAEILISSAVLSILQQVAEFFVGGAWGWVKNPPKNNGFCLVKILL